MKDSNRMIHYQGFQSTPGGGRRLQFSVEESHEEAAVFAITISGAAFTGPGKISFQESAGICRTMLREFLDAGTLEGKPPGKTAQLELTLVDIAKFREAPRGRR
ncbi:MAG TPA: hypothetical protein VK210_08365 [Terriglobia bacterium]|nr:hypothetical protein [Terriglobia bacterium]